MGCANLKRDSNEEFAQFRRMYRELIKFENDPAIKLNNTIIFTMKFGGIAYEGDKLWKAFNDYQSHVGAKKARSSLLQLIDKEGISTALILPPSKSFLYDELLSELLHARNKQTKLFTHLIGDPAVWSRVELVRENGRLALGYIKPNLNPATR